MKKIYALLIALCFAATGCFSTDDSNSQDNNNTVPEQTIRGFLEPKELSLTEPGTHTIISNGQSYLVQSSSINLNDYNQQSVELTGRFERNEPRMPSIFEVSAIQSVAAQPQDKLYEDEDLQISFFYRPILEAVSANNTVTLQNEQLDSAITIEETTDISDSARLTNANETLESFEVEESDLVYYIKHINKNLVYIKITASNESYKNDLKQVAATLIFMADENTASASASNIACGGEQNALCPEGYICEVEGDDPFGDGFCVSIDSIQQEKAGRQYAEEKQRQLRVQKEIEKERRENGVVAENTVSEKEEVETEEQEIWNSEQEINNEGTEEEDTKIEEQENTITESESTVTDDIKTNTEELSDQETEVSKYLRENIANLIKEEGAITISSIEFVEPNIIATELQVDSDWYKYVYTYKTSSGIELEQQSKYVEGATTTWDLESGEGVLGNKAKKIIKGDSIVNVPEGYALIENGRLGIRTYYPKKWYYSSLPATDEITGRVGFSNKPVEAGNELVSINKLSGEKLTDESSDNYYKYVEIDGDTFVVFGAEEYKEAIDTIAENLNEL